MCARRVGWEENRAHRSAEFEHGSKTILMEACVESPVDLLDNRMTIPPWGRDSDRMGESCGRRSGGGGGGHRWKECGAEDCEVGDALYLMVGPRIQATFYNGLPEVGGARGMKPR